MNNYKPAAPEWGSQLHRCMTQSLKSMLKRYRALLAKKQAVIVKHKPGTSYHTRATREAKTAWERIQKLETELRRRKQ